MKCLHVLPMNTLSGAEKLALILCKNMNKYEPIVVCGGEPLKTIFEENGIVQFGKNPKHTEATTLQQKIHIWQKEKGIRK